MQGYEFNFLGGGERYCISHIPQRKKVALCRVSDNGVQYTPIAYFSSEEEAELFCNFLMNAVNQ